MHTFKFLGLEPEDSRTPYYYGSLPSKPERGHVLVYDETGNRYVIFAIQGEGLSGDSDAADRQELAWAEIGRGEEVPTLLLQWLRPGPDSKPRGRSFDYEEFKAYSQQNRETRLSAKLIGFQPPEPPAPPRKWRFDIGDREGMIEETITPDNLYLYSWVARDGSFRLGILQSDRGYLNAEVEAKLRARIKQPGMAAQA